MQDNQSNTVRPALLNAVLWLGGVSLLLMCKDAVEQFTGPFGDSTLDLATVLVAYVLLFLLKPIRTWIDRRLRKHARRRDARLRQRTRA